jgi:hypothetical protein
MIKQTDENLESQFSSGEQLKRAAQLIDSVCRQKQVSKEALQSGSRIHEVSQIRSELAEKLVKEYGLSLAETVRRLGVTTAAIANAIRRRRPKN